MPGPESDGDAEVVLTGGHTHAEIVQIGDTVRRPTGPWTAGVHALLRHLEDHGFTAAPRVLGVDEQNREMLTFVPGTVVWPDHFDLVTSDAALEDLARLIREYHDAVASFDLSVEHDWADRARDPSGVVEVLCHNDLAPWNLVHGDGAWVFIDWDLAAPGRRSWDLAWALHTFVPLWPESGLDDDAVSRRVRRFCEAYGAPCDGDELIDVAIERCKHEARSIRARGAVGEIPYAQLLADGHDTIWEAAAAHVAQRAVSWKRLVA
jgi:aminoglycoside phosphotransferase (APT) family kinase protein